jgi:hypothetical protein
MTWALLQARKQIRNGRHLRLPSRINTSQKQTKPLKSYLSTLFGRLTRHRQRRKKFSSRTKTGSKAAPATSATTQPTNCLNKSWSRSGGNSKTANYSRRESTRKLSNSWTSGAKRVPGLRLRSSARRSIRRKQPTLRGREASCEQTGNLKTLILKWTLLCLTAPLTRAN